MNVTATIFGQMIAFAILVWFMHRYLWIPMNQMLEERKKRIADGLAAAERGKHDLERAEERANETLQEAKDQAADILAQAQRRANEIVEQAKSDARAESERILAAGQAELEQEVTRAKEELRRHVAAIAMDGAEQILGREIDRKAHDSILKKLVTEL